MIIARDLSILPAFGHVWISLLTRSSLSVLSGIWLN